MNAETVVLGARCRTVPDDSRVHRRHRRNATCSRNRKEPRAGLEWLHPPRRSFHAKLAAIEDDGRIFVAVKANVNLPGNPIRHGRPTIQGALVLLDGDDGRPLAIMDSIALTSLRTAAVAALAAEHLALSDSRTITIVGCGEQGEAQLCAMAAVRPLRAGFAVDVDPVRATSLADRLSIQLGWRLEPSTDLRELPPGCTH